MSNDTQPEIRFPGFTEAWEQRKLGELINVASASRVHKNQWTDSGVRFFRSSDVMETHHGNKNKKVFISESLYNQLSARSGKVSLDDVLVTGGGSVGMPYLVKDNEPLYFKDADLIWLKNSGLIYGYFLYTFFLTPTFRQYIKAISHIGTISHYTIDQVKETIICLPNNDEQIRVGDFFNHLDNTIALHQRKLDLLKEQKKGFLQKMFPKNGAKVPEIRFPGFTKDWEERKLGSIYDFSKGKGLPLNSFTYSKDDPAIAYGHLYTKYSEVISEVYLSSDDDGVLSKDNDLLFPGSSTVPNGTAQANAIMLNNVKLGGDIIIARPKQDTRVLSIFMSYQINSQRQKLFPITVGTTITHMYGKDLSKVKFFITNYSEQQKIGSFFKQLDDTIALHQRELDLLKETKKGFLQKMFV